jgi:hypothetical protein
VLPAPVSLPKEINNMALGKQYGNQLTRKQAEVEFDQKLSRLEDDIRKLKIDFDIYFNGATKRAPLEARARLESNIKRLADHRGMSFAQRYYLNTLVSRFTSYRELWRRTLKAKGEEMT